MASIQAGGFNGGDKSTDFSDGTNIGNEVEFESLNTAFDDESIGDVTCVKLQPALIAQDLCPALDLLLSLLIEPSWQSFIPDISLG